MDALEMLEAATARKPEPEAQATQAQATTKEETKPAETAVLEDGQVVKDGNTTAQEDGNSSDETPNPKGDDSAVEMPKDLEEYAEFLKSRGWDAKIANPIELSKELLKSYTELEKHNGRQGNLTGVLTEKLEEYEATIAGDPTRINEARKAIGLEPFQFTDPEEKATEINNLFNMFQKAYIALQSGKPDATTEASILEAVQKINDDARVHQKTKANQLPANAETLKVNARKSIANVAKETGEKFDDIIAKFDLVDKDADISNLFRSIAGSNLLALVSTPERAKGYNKLMQYVQKGMNFDAEVKTRVEKAVADKVAQLRKAQNAGGSNGGGSNPAGQKQVNNTARELFEMSRSNLSIIR